MRNKTNKTNKVKEVFKTPKSKPLVRLNKYIADAGVCSRRKADELIKNGLVTVNGSIVVNLATQVRIADNVAVEGMPLRQNARFTYIILNKPKDIITTTSDEKNRKTVMDIIKTRARVFPVGRLDRNTTGILLLTNDGDLAQKLTHPKHQIERIYNVGLDKPLNVNDATKISNGLELEEYSTSPCELIINVKNHASVTVILKEGKNREIRKIFEALGYEVKKLDRKYYANLSTRGLARGEYRHLNNSEISELKKIVELD